MVHGPGSQARVLLRSQAHQAHPGRHPLGHGRKELKATAPNTVKTQQYDLMNHNIHVTRRQFLKTSLAGAAGAAMMPTIIPSSVLGADAPSNKIQIRSEEHTSELQ